MRFRRVLAFVGTALMLPLFALGGTPSAQAAPARPIEPGVRMVTAGSSCTANFVFLDARGRTYLGYAAHCAAKSKAARAGGVANGCTTASLRLGTRVRFANGGATAGFGRLAYSSWTSMRRAGLGGPPCLANDFALVRVEKRFVPRVNSSVPHWGGPVALGTLPSAKSRVFSYVAASGRGAISPSSTEPRAGSALRTDSWSSIVFTAPSTSADAGSGFLDSRGRAVGVLSTTNSASGDGIGSLLRQVRFARKHGVPGLVLVPGKERFHASAVL